LVFNIKLQSTLAECFDQPASAEKAFRGLKKHALPLVPSLIIEEFARRWDRSEAGFEAHCRIMQQLLSAFDKELEHRLAEIRYAIPEVMRYGGWTGQNPYRYRSSPACINWAENQLYLANRLIKSEGVDFQKFLSSSNRRKYWRTYRR
jgi:hypothetical protein